jgi:hypothetical protein
MSDHPTPEELRHLFDQGRAAFQRAVTLDENPHPPGTIQRRKWQQGFCEPQPS